MTDQTHCATGTQQAYIELKRRVRDAGVFEPQPAYYAWKIAFTLLLWAFSLMVLIVADHSWLQMLNAVLLGCVFAQFGFIVHDLGHRQVFRQTRRADAAGLIMVLLIGLSWRWWVDRHNRHHGHPNEIGVDPDIDIPVFALTSTDALRKRGLLRWLAQRQAHLFMPLESLTWVVFLVLGAEFLLRRRPRGWQLELGVALSHYFGYAFLLLSFLSLGQAALFFIIHRLVFGLYLGSVAAPNHKGMPVVEGGASLDFLHGQIQRSRNVRPNPVTDFLCGGLNYQIEHHLFPTIPRNKLNAARRIVREFCRERAIPYSETSFLESYREIFRYFHQASAPLRARHRTAAAER